MQNMSTYSKSQGRILLASIFSFSRPPRQYSKSQGRILMDRHKFILIDWAPINKYEFMSAHQYSSLAFRILTGGPRKTEYVGNQYSSLAFCICGRVLHTCPSVFAALLGFRIRLRRAQTTCTCTLIRELCLVHANCI